ncbi:NADH-cytochrome b5 reductase-like isoform X1 [Polistes fuscatus]|uniref:NADH-cytochrome b5 reductase-like isoform X1 n=1 Tax=Polistes fuscatus TaxID=30207 RepID=UPI001CA7E414|nr:NADH-cytochrome b5 reductase-like isoform X1 [Polistes fuscatus]
MISNKNEDIYDSRPKTPPKESCCGSGCNPCILDVYQKLLKQWEERKKNNILIESIKNVISPTSFNTFVVINNYKASKDYIFIWLEYKGNINNNRSLYLIPGQHIVLRYGSMSKAYTPISWSETSLMLLVKIYPSGKFSQVLNNAKKNDEFEIRGPYGDFIYNINSFREIIMFCIGSGITAVYPLAKVIVENEEEETKINFIAGFRSISCVPLKKELRNLSDYWNFVCTIHISEDLITDTNQSIHGINIQNERLSKQSVYNYLQRNQKPKTTLILICGTDKFNHSIEQWSRENNYSHIHVFR